MSIHNSDLRKRWKRLSLFLNLNPSSKRKKLQLSSKRLIIRRRRATSQLKKSFSLLFKYKKSPLQFQSLRKLQAKNNNKSQVTTKIKKSNKSYNLKHRMLSQQRNHKPQRSKKPRRNKSLRKKNQRKKKHPKRSSNQRKRLPTTRRKTRSELTAKI